MHATMPVTSTFVGWARDEDRPVQHRVVLSPKGNVHALCYWSGIIGTRVVCQEETTEEPRAFIRQCTACRTAHALNVY